MTETMKWTWFVEPKKTAPVAVERKDEKVALSSMTLNELLFHALMSEEVAAV